MFTKYSLQQTNNKWNSSPIDCPHKVQTLSSLGILYHRPVSIGIRKFYALNFVIQILVFSNRCNMDIIMNMS